MSAERERLLAAYPFELDEFQRAAIDAIDAGSSVLVAAPTGSGKTVVAEYAVAKALAAGRRAFYTTPIKALSNQKYQDLCRRHGSLNVGLLTGDNAINGEAPVVVMTTEVLRNMIYARSAALDQLTVVILDEVHFLQDAYRGPVWEEVIIHLPRDISLVCLSATVSNSEELVAWMRTVRGATEVVVEERRPVELANLYLIGDRTAERIWLLPTLVDGRANAEAARIDSDAGRGAVWERHVRGRPRRKLFAPDRADVIDLLDANAMLPAIYFIFSRNACDDAAAGCTAGGMTLTTAQERDRIRQIVDERLGPLDFNDLAVLGYAPFVTSLEAGIAAHHAGLIPAFKETVEACFAEGLVKVVFATETLAVGINMPARTVVIEKLTKFTGERHELLTPSSYTQLTGRAGRRGIDTLGSAVVIWNPFITFEQVAALASSRSFALLSAFRPTFNMAANLVRSYPRERARQLLNMSFAQYQSDHEIVKLEARLQRRRAVLVELREQARSPFGDIDEYRSLTTRADRRAEAARPSASTVDAALARLRPGDVILLERGRHAGRVAVLTVASRTGGATRLRVITPNRISLALSAPDFDAVPKRVGELELPTPFAPNRQSFQREVARALTRARLSSAPLVPARHAAENDDLATIARHRVQADPDLGARMKAATQGDRVQREVTELERRVASHSESLARRFDRVLGVLERWGYLTGWELTDSGQRLGRLFHESDLLVMEALRRGLLDGLDPATFAALVSVFTYEHRSSDPPPPPWFPSVLARKRWLTIAKLGAELNAIEDDARLTITRAPDPTFAAVAFAWAAGEGFAEVVADEDLSGGDFVRNIKQLIDLVRQLGEIAPEPETRKVARKAAELLFRGVVAASSAVGAPV
jgi:ATP-dependent RNA helicase HelY